MHPFDTTPFTTNFAQPCDVSGFQKRLDELFGVEPITGRSWLRINWMPSDAKDEFNDPSAFDWDQYGDGGRGLWRRRYIWDSSQTFLDTFDHELGIWYSREVWDDIAPPRFVLERLIPPDIACSGYVHQGVDDDGAKWTERKPVHGIYEPLLLMPYVSTLLAGGVFADHDSVCCANAKASEQDCYGKYAEPSHRHIQELERLRFLKEKARETRPGVMTAADVLAYQQRARTKKDEYFNGLGERIGQIAKEAMRTHRASLSDDPSVQKHGLYHFMPTAKKESGIILTDL